jgi:Co/Zn/Cd efflux system component
MASFSSSDAGAEKENRDVAGPYPLSYQRGALHVQPPFDTEDDRPTNEHVLNVAFFSFFGFTMVQSGFALMVNSESMLADSEAMGVDAMTYLFNLCAERIKNAPISVEELQLSLEERTHKRKIKRLYLELIPPLISVATLIAVTIATMRDALHTLCGNEVDDSSSRDEEKVGVMLLFSSLNLLLDMVNVTCFARADKAFGIAVIQSQGEFRKSIRRASEDLSLLVNNKMPVTYERDESNGIELHASRAMSMDESSEEAADLVNLNMCSAWTVSIPSYFAQ